MIDEKKLMEFLDEEFCHDCTKCNGGCRIAEIEWAISKQTKVGEWILCSERLPDKAGKYIVSVKNMAGFWILDNPVFVCDYEFDTFIFQGWEDNDVIAWMPLPEPYRKEK